MPGCWYLARIFLQRAIESKKLETTAEGKKAGSQGGSDRGLQISASMRTFWETVGCLDSRPPEGIEKSCQAARHKRGSTLAKPNI